MSPHDDTHDDAHDDTVTTLALRCLWPGFAGGSVPGWVERALDAGMPGVVLYAHAALPAAAIAGLGREVSRRWPGALVGTDEEGGDVTRLEHRSGSSVPGNLALGHVDDVETTEGIGAALADALRASGVTVDLAPSVDVGSDARNPVVGTRSFGADPVLVARHGAAMVRGLHARGVVAVPKHFPGHGATTADSHLGPARLDVDAATLRARDLPPFAAAIDAGALAIMTGHVLVPAIDDAPATLSSAHLRGLLRDELGFSGAIVTDALDMAAVSRPRGIGGAAVGALVAGADLLLTGPGLGEDGGRARLDEAVAAITSAVADGSLALTRLRDAAAHVDALVAGAAALREAAPGPGPVSGGGCRDGGAALGLQVARTAVTVRGDLPLAREQRGAGVRVVELRSATNLAVGATHWSLVEPLQALGADVVALSAPADALPDPAGLAAAGEDDRRTLVLAVRDARLAPQLAAWVRHVLAAAPRAVLVCLGMPQDAALAPEGVVVVAARSAAAVSTRAAAEALWGR